jgi:hypothetical protein
MAMADLLSYRHGETTNNQAAGNPFLERLPHQGHARETRGDRRRAEATAIARAIEEENGPMSAAG